MRTLLPYLPFYFPILGLIVYIIKHEREHAKIWLLIKQLCGKARIDHGDG